MSDTVTKHEDRIKPKQYTKHSIVEYGVGLRVCYGDYGIDRLTSEEAIAYFPNGRIRGIWTSEGDSQSDYASVPSGQLTLEELRAYAEALHTYVGMVKQRFEEKIHCDLESDESFVDEEPVCSAAVEEQVDDSVDDATGDDISEWPSDKLASAIMDLEAEADMLRLREMILIAEDTDFTIEQSEQLAPWLLDFAKRYRDSNDPQDEVAIWSAIRTGASMLRPNAANCLRPLLEPGHSIETSLVTVKMVSRIFEAQPPAVVDGYKELAEEILHIAESLLNRYAITSSQSAAMAQLAIYALAAMACTKIRRIVDTVHGLGVSWFTQQTRQEFNELQTIWTSRPAPVAIEPCKLLDEAIQTLDRG